MSWDVKVFSTKTRTALLNQDALVLLCLSQPCCNFVSSYNSRPRSSCPHYLPTCRTTPSSSPSPPEKPPWLLLVTTALTLDCGSVPLPCALFILPFLEHNSPFQLVREPPAARSCAAVLLGFASPRPGTESRSVHSCGEVSAYANVRVTERSRHFTYWPGGGEEGPSGVTRFLLRTKETLTCISPPASP